MKVSIQNLIQEFTAVVFEKNELDFREIFGLKSLLPLLTHQDFDAEIIFEMLRNEEFASGIKLLRLGLWWNRWSWRSKSLDTELRQH